MSQLDEVISALEAITRRLVALERQNSELKRRLNGMFRMGTVSKDWIDAKGGTVRLEHGKGADGKPRLGPPLPWMEQGGAFKSWFPPSEGQTMVSVHPSGEPSQGFVLNGGFSNKNKKPSDKGDENKSTYGDFSMTLTKNGYELKFKDAVVTISASGITQKVGGVEVKHTSGGIDTTGGKLTHDKKNIGADHIHGGVQTGAAKTAAPEA